MSLPMLAFSPVFVAQATEQVSISFIFRLDASQSIIQHPPSSEVSVLLVYWVRVRVFAHASGDRSEFR